jgi:hypothetical protein
MRRVVVEKARPMFAGETVPRLVIKGNAGRVFLRVADVSLGRYSMTYFAILVGAQPRAQVSGWRQIGPRYGFQTIPQALGDASCSQTGRARGYHKAGNRARKRWTAEAFEF